MFGPGARIEKHLASLRDKIKNLPVEKLASLDAGMSLDFSEHFEYQKQQSKAFAMGKLTQGEAQFCYSALGEVGSEANGGWAKDTDLATKVLVTKIIGELLGAKIPA